MDRLSTAKVYTKLDIRNAYHRIRIAEGDEWKTAFRTQYGLFEYTVMPFGLTNAPASFQGLINDTLREFLDLFVVVYLDDILIYSENLTDHYNHVNLVLEKLRGAGLYAKAEKCEFDVTEVEFLGFKISPKGIFMDQSKVSAITNWSTPRSVHDIQVFLGFSNFFRRFIQDYSKLTVPMTALTKKNVPFVWSTEADQSFQQLKTAFTSAPILHHFDPSSKIIIETDASDFAIAGVLSQYGSDSLLHPVAFYSRKLNTTEVNYDIYDKELLAIIECFKTWRHYLQGASHQITVYTDHKNLEYFATTKSLNRRQARWSIFMSSFDFFITYRPGTKNPKADALSRRSDMAFQGEVNLKQPNQRLFHPEQVVLSATFEVAPDSDICSKIHELSKLESKLSKLVDFIKNPSTIPSKLRKRLSRYTIDPQSNLLLFDNLTVTPKTVPMFCNFVFYRQLCDY
ncbi:hypothetical protein G6F46_012399 [Rhizopus delemar]|uniref:Reverse transcriptase domain-containing protein n=3 Tax=Rhizopus TaxID=4842 RepID=I1CSK4_RHIO9|nr:hypothetical protein RO3G_16145 [Rhizopus delemar RA 99-880]KAG1444546.1 hypothetical protein G6F55_012284 [Rhizopus delemar]KAG1533239.1 hypothetical protein G6F51_012718 [Rhizopus arrhizus]KAG1488307.1 hypothetical protein G6F54_012142 [Rhizopus delemar]KAG1493593.1 hypothetical protein G6F53_012728 [Rhizopus delemar]|eukprot:EIE91434.1 hypothetical protein RO3G_16145 [Rhizopus delemar RA 99-880]